MADYTFIYHDPQGDTQQLWGDLYSYTPTSKLAAGLLYDHTGRDVATVTDRHNYEGLHVQGSSSYSLLADEAAGGPTLTVMTHEMGGVQRVLSRATFDTWEQLAEAAGSINLGG